MNYRQLIRRIQSSTDLNARAIRMVLDAMAAESITELRNGEPVTLADLGTIYAEDRIERVPKPRRTRVYVLRPSPKVTRKLKRVGVSLAVIR